MALNSKKKILYIITKSVWGGAGKYTYDIATNLHQDKFEVFVSAGGHGKLAEKIEENNIPYFEIKNFQRDMGIFKDLFAFLEIFSLLLKIKPDIIHVSSSKAGGIAGLASFFYPLFSFRFSLLKIFTVHGWAFAEKRPPFQIKLIKFFSKLTCVFYKKIICVSSFDKQLAISNKTCPKKKLLLIHNGIDTDNYYFLTKEKARNELITNNKLQITENQENNSNLWIGTIGEFTKNKGQKYIIEAINKIKVKNTEIKTVLMGWGEEKSNLKSQISNLKLENKVFLVENIFNASKYIKAFDLFILPSLKEGFPYVLLEAGLARLPVIASRVGGIPEIIENKKNGILIEPENTAEIKESIENLISNIEMQNSISFSLWEKVNREFNLKKMLDLTLTAYEKNS